MSEYEETDSLTLAVAEAMADHSLWPGAFESADTDFTDYLTKRAAAALRGKITLPGVTVKDELK